MPKDGVTKPRLSLQVITINVIDMLIYDAWDVYTHACDPHDLN
jgi:hypothetical protein